jgi:HEAT repeat protein
MGPFEEGDLMRTMASRCLAVIIAVAASAAALRADEPRSGAPERDIKRLIDQLGSERFEDREQATHQLSNIGKAALPNLKEAANSPDAEVRRRAHELVEQMEPPAARARGSQPEQQMPAAKSYL